MSIGTEGTGEVALTTIGKRVDVAITAIAWRLGSLICPAAVCGAALLLAGCEGIQSSLAPAGTEAATIARLFWWMTAGAVVVWAAVVALAIYVGRLRSEREERWGRKLIVIGGAVVPTAVLTGLLAYGLWLLPSLVAPAPAGSLTVDVLGEMWWWRVRYPTPAGGEVEMANEVRLPVGEPVEFRLASSNVIHAFWIPSLAGKKDLIPGRVTRLALTPTRTGVFRGACAEYCGTAHAQMSFYAVVMEKAEFADWLNRQAQPAREPTTEAEERGRRQFSANGCGACHTIRGTKARGVIGPDLTHIGSRLSIAGGILSSDVEQLQRWIKNTKKLKPGVHMPAFGMLPEEDVKAIAVYLGSLK